MGKIIGVVVLVLVIVLALFLWMKRGGNEGMAETGGENMKEAVSEMKEAVGEKSMVASIKDAMGLGQKMQCTYAMSEGESAVESTVFVDGDKFKSTTVVGGMTIHALFDGENQYSWTSATKTGMQMSKACLEKMQDSVKDMTKPSTTPAPTEPQDMEKAFDMAKNVKCQPATGADFTVPKDITFTDQCAMIEQSLKMMEGIKDQLPAGVTIPGMAQ
jgi:hypothetical protein